MVDHSDLIRKSVGLLQILGGQRDGPQREVLVHRGVLAGKTDHAPDLVGMPDGVDAGEPGVPASGRSRVARIRTVGTRR